MTRRQELMLKHSLEGIAILLHQTARLTTSRESSAVTSWLGFKDLLLQDELYKDEEGKT